MRPLFVAVACAAALLAACSDSGAPACRSVQREPLDSRSTQHLFPDAPDPTFLTDPPTSGPHRPGLHPTGVLQKPIDRGVQVSMLEGGAVLLQYKNLSDRQRAQLVQLAGGPVSVAPNP